MRYRLVCLLIAYTALCPSANSQSPRTSEKKAETNSDQTNAKDKAPPVSETQILPVAETNRPQEEGKNPWWDALVSNWPLVVIGVLGTIAATRTLIVIGRQMEAMINAERAWLLIHSDFEPKVNAPAGKFDWNIKNSGRTTATIEETSVRCQTKRPMEPFPAVPVYRDPIEARKVPIAPGQSLWFWSYFG